MIRSAGIPTHFQASILPETYLSHVWFLPYNRRTSQFGRIQTLAANCIALLSHGSRGTRTSLPLLLPFLHSPPLIHFFQLQPVSQEQVPKGFTLITQLHTLPHCHSRSQSPLPPEVFRAEPAAGGKQSPHLQDAEKFSKRHSDGTSRASEAASCC